jgi:hypothetical protein
MVNKIKRPVGRPKGEKKNDSPQVRLTRENYEAMQARAKRNRRPLTQELNLAVETWLKGEE